MLNRARLAYIGTRILDTPFWAIYNMLPVILYKDLHISPMQLAVMIALRPLVSLFSMYWSSVINGRPDRLVSNILWARALGYAPFFFFPFVNNAWFFIFSFGFYMMLTVGIVPAWMEILKLTVPSSKREKVFSYTQAFGYLGGGLLPFVIGWLLDGYFQAWRWLFPLASGVALLAFLLQMRMYIPSHEKQIKPDTLGLLQHLLKPWKTAWQLLQERQDYRWLQWGCMLLGCGLMLMQPTLPIFFVDVLNLSYMELSIAITLCKGIGFVIASPLWSSWMHRVDIYRLNSWIAGLACLFPLCLILAKWQLGWLYIGYIFYGIMQSGNELVWNMSGPLFAKEKDSSVYTSVNIVAVGLRGCFVPAAGSALCSATGAPFVMLVSGLFCLAAVARFFSYSRTPLQAKLE